MEIKVNNYNQNFNAKLRLQSSKREELLKMFEVEANGKNKKALNRLMKEFKKMYPNTVIECSLTETYVKNNIYETRDLVIKNTRNGEVREFTASTDEILISNPAPFAEMLNFLTNLGRSSKFWGVEIQAKSKTVLESIIERDM